MNRSSNLRVPKSALFGVGLVFLLISCTSPGLVPEPKEKKSLWLISIDGLRPEFYRQGNPASPHMQEILKKGAKASSVIPVYPTVTYPNHTSLVTGTYSFQHGVYSNRVFNPGQGPSLDWYWQAHAIQKPTLWDAASSAGLKSALVNWPVTVHAKADWVIPEIFPRDHFEWGAIWNQTTQATRPDTLNEVLAASETQEFVDSPQHDAWMAQAAMTLARLHSPQLLLLHLTQLDLAQHFHGREAPEVRQALQNIDTLLGQIVANFHFDRDCLLITGDHGFSDVRQIFRINRLFAQKGWLKSLTQWEAIAQTNGAQAAIYLKNSTLLPEVLAALKPWQKNRFKVLTREDLDRLQALPGAAIALEPGQSWGFHSDLAGELIEKLPHPQGEHGRLPSVPQMHTGLIAAGACVHSQKDLGQIELIDVAPTAARFLGIPLPEAQGKPLDL